MNVLPPPFGMTVSGDGLLHERKCVVTAACSADLKDALGVMSLGFTKMF